MTTNSDLVFNKLVELIAESVEEFPEGLRYGAEAALVIIDLLMTITENNWSEEPMEAIAEAIAHLPHPEERRLFMNVIPRQWRRNCD